MGDKGNGIFPVIFSRLAQFQSWEAWRFPLHYNRTTNLFSTPPNSPELIMSISSTSRVLPRAIHFTLHDIVIVIIIVVTPSLLPLL